MWEITPFFAVACPMGGTRIPATFFMPPTRGRVRHVRAEVDHVSITVPNHEREIRPLLRPPRARMAAKP
jgi:hypothetical protein